MRRGLLVLVLLLGMVAEATARTGRRVPLAFPPATEQRVCYTTLGLAFMLFPTERLFCPSVVDGAIVNEETTLQQLWAEGWRIRQHTHHPQAEPAPLKENHSLVMER